MYSPRQGIELYRDELYPVDLTKTKAGQQGPNVIGQKYYFPHQQQPGQVVRIEVFNNFSSDYGYGSTAAYKTATTAELARCFLTMCAPDGKKLLDAVPVNYLVQNTRLATNPMPLFHPFVFDPEQSYIQTTAVVSKIVPVLIGYLQ